MTAPRDSVDYRRASATQNGSIQMTYRRFHAFIELQIRNLQSPDSLLDIMLINTLDGIKRQSTVNLFNLFTRAGKLSEVDRQEAPE